MGQAEEAEERRQKDHLTVQRSSKPH
jgi:hypothetical protein